MIKNVLEELMMFYIGWTLVLLYSNWMNLLITVLHKPLYHFYLILLLRTCDVIAPNKSGLWIHRPKKLCIKKLTLLECLIRYKNHNTFLDQNNYSWTRLDDLTEYEPCWIMNFTEVQKDRDNFYLNSLKIVDFLVMNMFMFLYSFYIKEYRTIQILISIVLHQYLIRRFHTTYSFNLIAYCYSYSWLKILPFRLIIKTKKDPFIKKIKKKTIKKGWKNKFDSM